MGLGVGPDEEVAEEEGRKEEGGGVEVGLELGWAGAIAGGGERKEVGWR